MESGELSKGEQGADECPLWAHSRGNGSGRRHLLEDHLRSVGWWAAKFAEPFGADQIAYWLGLTHDFGKASEIWQRRLLEVEGADEPVGVDHRAAGTRFLVEHLGFDVFAMPVYGHHGGLDHPSVMANFLASPPLEVAHEEQALQRLRARLPELATPSVPVWPACASDPLGGELLTRMLFSALVDADHLDTQVHFGKRREHVAAQVDPAHLLDRFEAGRKDKLREQLRTRGASPVDPLRGEVYEACVAAASLGPGFFKLAAPTGLGKTISSAGFALHHASVQGLRRVVVAVPFISITEQNAEVYRELLGSTPSDPLVLEHHSSVALEGPGSRWQRLAAENWDAPFIVTTTVQLLQSLHDRRPWAMRKLHRLARSVVVLDEIQALPVHLLIPILAMLRQLVEHFGVTVVLASATQPEFWDLAPLRQVRAVDILPDPAGLQRRLRRIRPMRYRWEVSPRPSLEQVATKVAAEPARQVLVVVNTVDHARIVYDALNARRPGMVRHLSTRMCPAHRRDVLADVDATLKRKPVEPLNLVSTQLIEAGVDLDFPVVYRAMSPAESILQAAGRANREGQRPESGLVVIFDPAEQAMPASYGLPVAETRRRFGPMKQPEPDDLGTLADYFRGYYATLPENAMGSQLLAARASWDFPTVTKDFRMIDEDSVPVVVRYHNPQITERPDPIDGWLQQLRRDPARGHIWLRRLQPYTISLPKSQLAKPQVAALLRPVIGDLYEWAGVYDLNIGIVIPAKEENPREQKRP
ncbi:CRISPR-associated helicase Cas3' [Microbispora sp. NBRC 16548]|uniref:CRISPR-associated helicase Cas3' n=1 Tax=Microbispora sp. NBRC 16548 TaxID=3030994 RepID=UPI0025521A5A|nr:CRISPR-associated helicase Cas3' [Microbispora sp. NBRC 16548]